MSLQFAVTGNETPSVRQTTDSFFLTVYEELRSLATAHMSRERLDHTLTATSLVNEAYVRLSSGTAQTWENRAHFFAAVAESMRRVLIERARAKQTLKRRRLREYLPLDGLCINPDPTWDWMVDLEDALSRLAWDDAQAAQLVTLRIFSGMSVVEAGQALGSTKWSAYKLWEFAQCWFAAYAAEFEYSYG